MVHSIILHTIATYNNLTDALNSLVSIPVFTACSNWSGSYLAGYSHMFQYWLLSYGSYVPETSVPITAPS